MTNQERSQRNKINLQSIAAAAIVPGLMIYFMGPSSLMAAPVLFVVTGAMLRANLLHKLDLNSEVV